MKSSLNINPLAKAKSAAQDKNKRNNGKASMNSVIQSPSRSPNKY